MNRSTTPSRDCKVTLESVIEELEQLDLTSIHLLSCVDVWLLLPLSGDSWSIYTGFNPSRVCSAGHFGRSSISPVDLVAYDKESLEIIAAELIDDLTEHFTNDELPELLRD